MFFWWLRRKDVKLNHLLFVQCRNIMVPQRKGKVSIQELSDKWKFIMYPRHQVLLPMVAELLTEWDKGDYFSWSIILQWLQELVKNTLSRSSLFPGHTYVKAKSFQLPVCTFYAYWITRYWNKLYTYCIFMHKLHC